MYSRLTIFRKYINYYLNSSNGKGHGIHSPFIYNFINKVLNDNHVYPEYEKVEALRNQLLNDRTLLEISDLGAGSSSSNSGGRTIASIAKHSVKSKKFGQLLFRIVKEYQPSTIVELGTSLGISTAYMALANKESRVITIEGSESVAKKAESNFLDLNLLNIQLIKGNFDQELPIISLPAGRQVISSPLSVINLAFIDGNHRKVPTLNYFHQLLSKSNNDSIFIFDDIHWSPEMEEAWSIIQNHESVRCTIDLFFMGIVFFRQEFKEKQHFRIRY